jgi:cytochrome P450
MALHPGADTEVFDWFAPSMRVDPHPDLHRLRARSPIHRNDLGWWVLGYDEADRVLHGPGFARNRERFLENFRHTLGDGIAYEYVTRRLSYYGAGEHRRLRGTVARAFTPRRIAMMRSYVSGLAEELLDRVVDMPSFDVLESLAHPLPSLVICQMLGVPDALRADFDRWTTLIPHLIAPKVTPEQLDLGTRAVIEEWACVERLIEERRSRPGDDLLTALIDAEEGGRRLTREELIANVIFLFSAGHQTTRDSLGLALLGMLRPRDAYAAVVRDPSLAAAAVEEALRWGSVVALSIEQVQEHVDLGGTHLSPGEDVWIVLPAANRDPARFPDPDRFRLDRPSDQRHLSFSSGAHHCLGAALGRLELTVLLEVLARRLPDAELADQELEWRDTVFFRGVRSLRIAPRG